MLNSRLAFFGQTCPDAPKDIAELLMRNYTPNLSDKASLGLVNKSWHEVYESDSFWIESGAESREDFISRFDVLDDKLKNLVCFRVYKLSFSEKIQNVFNMMPNERINALLTPEQASGMNPHKLNALLSETGVQALREALISVEQASGMNANQLVG